MHAALLDAVVLVPGGEDGLAADLRAGTRREGAIELSRLPGIAAGTWRRMSRLARLVATAASPMASESVPVVFGTAIGEIVPTARFQQRLYTEGADRASPLAFQNSVYNAPAGHLSIALGLKGASETISAGGATGLACLLRAMALLERHEQVLVVAGDDANPSLARACELNGLPAPGEAVAACLIGRSGGPRIHLEVGPAPLSRHTALPLEGELATVPGSVPIEACLGLSPSSGLAALLALRHDGGTVVDVDGPRTIGVSISP